MVTKYSPVELNNLLSVEEAAEYGDYSQQYVRRPLRPEKLAGLKVAQLWLIDKQILDLYLENTHQKTDLRFGPK